MIQANEVRLGNRLILSDGSNEFPITVEPHDFQQMLDGDRLYKPIPLTPEILEKCGFEITGIQNDTYTLFLSEYDSTKFSRQRIDFYVDNTHGKVELCRSGVCFKMVPCQYLHQLQNLYFALTGQELTVNL